MSKKAQKKAKKSYERQVNNSCQITEEFACKKLKRIIYRHTKTKYRTKPCGRSSKVRTYTTEEIREYQNTKKMEI